MPGNQNADMVTNMRKVRIAEFYEGEIQTIGVNTCAIHCGYDLDHSEIKEAIHCADFCDVGRHRRLIF